MPGAYRLHPGNEYGHHALMSEVWLLNPEPYPRTLATRGHAQFLWEKEFLEGKRIDHRAFATTVLRNMPYSYIVLEKWGAVEWRSGYEGHTGVFPVWSFKDSWADLIEMCDSGPKGAGDTSKIPDFARPRMGQPHMLFIRDVPDASTGIGRRFYLDLRDLSKEYENLRIVIHRINSFRIGFGLGFHGCVTDPWGPAKKGCILLPSGKTIRNKEIIKYPRWCKQFGYTPHELMGSPEKRLSYNLSSLDFASNHFNKTIALRDGMKVTEDTSVPASELTYPEIAARRRTPGQRATLPIVGDKIQCDTCSLSTSCGYARDGAVCTLPGSETSALARMFETRDSQSIVSGLHAILGRQAGRLERAMDEEDAIGDLDPGVSKLAGQVFTQGVALAKLIDPNMRGGTKVQVNVGVGSAAEVGMGPGQDTKQVMAKIFAELEQMGYRREQITPELVQAVIDGKLNAPQLQTIDADPNPDSPF